MSRTQPGKREDAAAKRREYLRAKVGMVAIIGFGAALILAIAFVTLAVISNVFSRMHLMDISIMVMCAVFLAIAGVLTYAGVDAVRIAHKQSAALPFVPPVDEQIAALPAVEILVRGSEPPAAQPEELLRAAQRGVETDPTELLRAEQSP